MNSPQNTNEPFVPTTPPKPNQDKADDQASEQYGEALIKMVNFNYAEQHPEQAKRSQPLSTKQIIFLIILIMATILGAVIYSHFNNSSGSNNSSSENGSQTKQLLHSAETFGNPNSY